MYKKRNGAIFQGYVKSERTSGPVETYVSPTNPETKGPESDENAVTARDVAGEHVGGEGEGDTDSFLSVVDSDKEENFIEDGG